MNIKRGIIFIVLLGVGLFWSMSIGQQNRQSESEFFKHYFDSDRMGQIPAKGYVSKAATAIRIAEAIIDDLSWPKEKIKGPLKTKFMNGVWIVYCWPSDKELGKVMPTFIEIDARTGSILRFVQSIH
jgi:hypothetical protein